MAGKNKMPPELLAHFKSKTEGKERTDADSKVTDKQKRKEAVNKARVRLESRSKRQTSDKKEEAS